MGNIIKHLRGTTTDHASYTGEKGVISVVTGDGPEYVPTGEIRVHDGQTPGGINPVDAVVVSSGSSVTTTEIDAITSDVSDVANNVDLVANNVDLVANDLSDFENRFVGMIASFAMETPPAGWHVCNGGEYSITSYSELYAAIGTTWGDLTDGSGGAGSTHFRVPDLRGEFLRGFDNSAGTDPDAASRTGGDTVGSSQGNNIRETLTKSHSPYNSAHSGKTLYLTSSGSVWGAWNPDITFQGASYSFEYGPLNTGYVTTLKVGSGSDTRPINKAVQYCIKY